jgi:thiol-disulfide isomerase/thioredoxin
MRLSRAPFLSWLFAGVAVLATAGFLVGRAVTMVADEDKPAASGDSKADEKKPLKVTDIKPETLAVPTKGTPKDLMRYIRDTLDLQPTFESEAEAVKFLKMTRQNVIVAVDKLLQSKATPEQEAEALRAKLESYQVLLIVGVPDTLPKALKFAEELKKDPRPELASIGAAAWLDFRMSSLPKGDAKERGAVIDAVAAELRKKPKDYYEVAQQLGRMLEMLGDGASAAAAYEKFGDILSNNLDPQLHMAGERLKTGAVRRARLLTGDPLKIAGTTIDGKPFNISQYKGKVVVVDFWATWCGPCLQELPNLKAVYEKYHDRGLEVVGVSLDDDKEELTKFLKQNDLPWKILVSTDAGKKGFDNPNSDYYGISGIPAIFLMNREGKVVSLEARGEKLGELVASLLDGKGESK